MKLSIALSVALAALFYTGCSSSSSGGQEFDSIGLGEIENKIITYDNNGEEHSYQYCAGDELRYGSNYSNTGSYVVNGNDVDISEDINSIYYTITGNFVVGTEYTVGYDDHTEKVIKIEESICEAR
ncbi:MAG: hypothetical protein U9R50_04145 [Campylobacterota bacterium]|nr:hypothetical protein [Campylobacterota bacterium]